jgi:hypothetical protein
MVTNILIEFRKKEFQRPSLFFCSFRCEAKADNSEKWDQLKSWPKN